jgi:murein DD-endopeptidase MepM/ murein hydrolase activator NlpD
MDIRGNFVAVDHGYGIYSTYSHLSMIHVTRGQQVVKGQIIGLTGDTGRSSGPHFHWEMAVNGEFVDSVQFTETWLP